MTVKRALLIGSIAAGVLVLRNRRVRREVRSRIEQLQRAIAFLPVTASAVEWDYAGLLHLIEAWCERAAHHHAEHQRGKGWERTARELRWAAILCRRIMTPPYLTTLGYDIAYGFGPEPASVRLRNAGIARLAQAQQEADVQALLALLRRKLRTWWD